MSHKKFNVVDRGHGSQPKERDKVDGIGGGMRGREQEKHRGRKVERESEGERRVGGNRKKDIDREGEKGKREIDKEGEERERVCVCLRVR